jgi:NAD(P)-dependent dehydrogenase (short-subunit alcohol dehydrogenase family)
MAAKDAHQGKKSDRGRLAGKVAIVTGSAEGMGEVMAKLFAQKHKVPVPLFNEAA